MKKVLSLALILTMAMPVKSDINVLMVYQNEKQYLLKDDHSKKVGVLTQSLLDHCEKAKESGEKLAQSSSYFSVKNSSNVTQMDRYSITVFIGIIYTGIKDLTKEEKQDLVQKAQDSFKDLMENEVFGQREVVEGFFVYCVPFKIEKVNPSKK